MLLGQLGRNLNKPFKPTYFERVFFFFKEKVNFSYLSQGCPTQLLDRSTRPDQPVSAEDCLTQGCDIRWQVLSFENRFWQVGWWVIASKSDFNRLNQSPPIKSRCMKIYSIKSCEIQQDLVKVLCRFTQDLFSSSGFRLELASFGQAPPPWLQLRQTAIWHEIKPSDSSHSPIGGGCLNFPPDLVGLVEGWAQTQPVDTSCNF